MTTENELESAGIKAAAKAAKSQGFKVPERVTLSNGIELLIKPMPPMLLTAVTTSVPEPPVPMIFLEEKGRDEPNPNHPDYVRAMDERAAVIGLATTNLILYACSSVVSVPEGIYKPEDEGWVKLTEMAGIKFDKDDPAERYLAWLRSYAVATMDDMKMVQNLPLQLAGISEAEVDEVEDSFRGTEERGAVEELPVEVGSENGNHVSSGAARGRTRN